MSYEKLLSKYLKEKKASDKGAKKSTAPVAAATAAPVTAKKAAATPAPKPAAAAKAAPAKTAEKKEVKKAKKWVDLSWIIFQSAELVSLNASDASTNKAHAK